MDDSKLEYHDESAKLQCPAGPMDSMPKSQLAGYHNPDCTQLALPNSIQKLSGVVDNLRRQLENPKDNRSQVLVTQNTSWALADIKDQQCKLLDSSYVLAETQSYQNDGPDYEGQGVSLDREWVGLEPDLTIPMQPNNKVGPEAPFMIEDDQENFYNPILDTFRMLLEANATQTYLKSLNPKGRQTVSNLLKIYLLAETDETPIHIDSEERAELISSSPLVATDQDSLPDTLFDTLKILVVVKSTQSYISSLPTAGRQIIHDFLDALLKIETKFSNYRFSQL